MYIYIIKSSDEQKGQAFFQALNSPQSRLALYSEADLNVIQEHWILFIPQS